MGTYTGDQYANYFKAYPERISVDHPIYDWRTWNIKGLDGNDTLIGGILNDTIEGGNDNDSLEGLAGNDILDGGSGADKMYGGIGDDTYYVNRLPEKFGTIILPGDEVYENAGEGDDTVYASVNYYALDANVERLFLIGNTISGSGNNLDNKIYGNGANNRLNGYEGNDTLDGSSGADTMTGGAGNDNYFVDTWGEFSRDSVIEYTNQGTDTVYLSAIPDRYTSDFTLYDNVENVVLIGSNAVKAIGNSLDNQITGNGLNNVLKGEAGNDTLDGGIGSDTMIGGIGNDTYHINSSTDVITEDVNSGTDKIISSVSNYSLAANVENLQLTGSAFYGYGNTLDNEITGNSVNNYLVGNGGTDLLLGGLGNDTLIGFGGTAGNEYDTLVGEGGADTFVLGDSFGVFYHRTLSSVDGYGKIKDFIRAEGDKIQVYGNLSDYTLDQSAHWIGGSAIDTRIFYKEDLIAIVADTTNISIQQDFVIA